MSHDSTEPMDSTEQMDPLTRACRSGFTAAQLLDFFRDFIKPRLFPQAVVWWVRSGDTPAHPEHPVLCVEPANCVEIEWPIRDVLAWTYPPPAGENDAQPIGHGPVAVVKSLQSDKGTPEESRWLLVPEWVSGLVPPAQRLTLRRRDKARQDGAVLDWHVAVKLADIKRVVSGQDYRTSPLAQVWHVVSELRRVMQGTTLDVVECFAEDLPDTVRL